MVLWYIFSLYIFGFLCKYEGVIKKTTTKKTERERGVFMKIYTVSLEKTQPEVITVLKRLPFFLLPLLVLLSCDGECTLKEMKSVFFGGNDSISSASHFIFAPLCLAI